MQITCPWCGPRPLDEFAYGGDATKKRPRNPDKAGLDGWMDYVFYRENPAGRHKEYWQHVGGCRAWLVAERDTATHAFAKVALARPLSKGRKR